MENPIPFEEVAALWLADKRKYVKPSTAAVYALVLKTHLIPWFASCTDLTEESIQRLVDHKLAAGLGRKTVRDMLLVLKMVRRFGVKHGWYENLLMDIHFPPEGERREVEVLAVGDQQRVMKYLKQHLSYRNLGLYICLTAGLRIGEVCALRWADLDIDAGVIHVSKTLQRIYDPDNGSYLSIDTPKTRTSLRDIPMTCDLAAIVRSLRKLVRPDFYVLTNSDRPLEPRRYRDYYCGLMRKLDVPPMRFHALRHSFATRCIESKCDYKTVSVILGHAHLSTTLDLYVHPDNAQKKRCLEQMRKALGNP